MKRYFLVKRVMIFFVIGFAITIYSCKHEPIIPDQPEISFSHDIMPIIAANCQSSGCHGLINPEEIQLLTYDDMVDGELVIPYNTNQSELYRAITTSSGEDAMPRAPQSPLSNTQIKLIYVWIKQGAKNN